MLVTMYVNDPMQGILVCRPNRLVFLNRTGGVKSSFQNQTSDMEGIIFGTKPHVTPAHKRPFHRNRMSSTALLRVLKYTEEDDLLFEEFDEMTPFTPGISDTKVSILDGIRGSVRGHNQAHVADPEAPIIL